MIKSRPISSIKNCKRQSGEMTSWVNVRAARADNLSLDSYNPHKNQTCKQADVLEAWQHRGCRRPSREKHQKQKGQLVYLRPWWKDPVLIKVERWDRHQKFPSSLHMYAQYLSKKENEHFISIHQSSGIKV